jgi:hypothetical protein
LPSLRYAESGAMVRFGRGRAEPEQPDSRPASQRERRLDCRVKPGNDNEWRSPARRRMVITRYTLRCHARP